jgi:hypothetical protein
MRAITLSTFGVMTFVAASVACGSSGGSSDNGSNGGGSSSGGGGGSGAFATLGDAGWSSSETAAGLACGSLGDTRVCCGTAKQTCQGTGEFFTWGPCLDPSGSPVSCPTVGTGCGVVENAQGCDGGSSTPPPGPPPAPGPTPLPSLCNDPTINNEPEILVAYSPSATQTVGQNGQIKVWVNDERPPFIAPGEKVDPTTGAVVVPGDRTAKAPDGLLWEPALYFLPQTPQNGGTPYFPQYFKGEFDNGVATTSGPPTVPADVVVPGMDPPPAGTTLHDRYTNEDIWNVAAIGLSPGTYTALFAVHDGDRDRAIGCVTITVTP